MASVGDSGEESGRNGYTRGGEHLSNQLVEDDNKSVLVSKLLNRPGDQEPSPLDPVVLAMLAARMPDEEEVTQESLAGLKQKVVSTKIDLANKSLFLSHISETGDERNNRRPADVFVPLWAGGLDAALDVTITSK